MSEKAQFKQIGGYLFACSACGFKVEFNYHKKLNAGQVQKRIDIYTVLHAKACPASRKSPHSEEASATLPSKH